MIPSKGKTPFLFGAFTMVTFASLSSFLTADQLSNAKAKMYGLRAIEIRGKKAAAEWEAKGFKLEKVSAQYYCVDWEQAKAFNAYLNQHGEAVKVVRVDGKYDDSMGAYEVVTVADENGEQWEVGNMYDQSVCFRLMNRECILEYVNAQ